MKKIGLILWSLFLIQIVVQAQCGVNYQETLEKYCSGSYLVHQELDNRIATEARVILHSGNLYNIYLLNPSQRFSEFRFLSDSIDISEEFDIIEERKAAKYQLSVDNTREYNFSFLTQADEEACVLLAIYLHSDLDKAVPAGVYQNFAELKYRSPAFPNTYSFTKKKVGTPIRKIYHYKLNVSRNERKRFGEVYAFTDGEDMYINIAPRSKRIGLSTRFAKAEDLKIFYFFEYYETTVVPNQYGGIHVDSWKKKLIDKRSGKVITLNRTRLQQIIMDDPELSDEFRQESSKSKKLKEYLIRYVDRNHLEY
jgi:hypothetical protein